MKRKSRVTLTSEEGQFLLLVWMVVVVVVTVGFIWDDGGSGKNGPVPVPPTPTPAVVEEPTPTPDPNYQEIVEFDTPVTMFVVGDHVIERSEPNRGSTPKYVRGGHLKGEAVTVVAIARSEKFLDWYQLQSGGWIREDLLAATYNGG